MEAIQGAGVLPSLSLTTPNLTELMDMPVNKVFQLTECWLTNIFLHLILVLKWNWWFRTVLEPSFLLCVIHSYRKNNHRPLTSNNWQGCFLKGEIWNVQFIRFFSVMADFYNYKCYSKVSMLLLSNYIFRNTCHGWMKLSNRSHSTIGCRFFPLSEFSVVPFCRLCRIFCVCVCSILSLCMGASVS